VRQLIVTPQARRDLLESAEYLQQEGGLALAERFLEAVHQDFGLLVRMPEAGSCCGFTGAITRQIRRWPVSHFENWLIFYLPQRSGVQIVRVVHGARDIESLFDK
jgi:toxin ParE1/3/4